MTKKTDIQECIEALTAEIAEKVGRNIGGGIKTPLIVMQRPLVRCSGVRLERFTEMEYMSVQALLAWAAANTNVSEISVGVRTAAMFDAKCVEDIDRCHYDDVIRYLADFSSSVN